MSVSRSAPDRAGLPTPESVPARGMARSIESWIGRFLALIVILIILYAGVLLAARTEGFRALAAQRMEKRIGIPVRIERSALSPTLELRFMGVRAGGGTEESMPADDAVAEADPIRAVLSAEEVRIRFEMPRFRMQRLVIRGAWLEFAWREGEGWQPAALAARLEGMDRAWGLGLFPSLQGGMPPAEDVTLVLEDMNVAWYRGAGSPRCAAEGLSLFVTPLRVPGRRLLHVRMDVRRRYTGDAGAPGPYAMEWIIHEGGRVPLNAAPAGIRGQGPGPAEPQSGNPVNVPEP